MPKPPDRSDDFLAFMAARNNDVTVGGQKVGELKSLNISYRVDFRPERVRDLVRFIKAREHARQTHDLRGQISEREMAKRVAATDDIIRQYRFCNVRREDDRVTRWLADHWRTPNAGDPHLWFAMCVARMALNSVDSMADLEYPLPWRPKEFLAMAKRRVEKGLKIYGPAYMIATPNWTGPKHNFLVERLLTPMWERRVELRPVVGDTLASFHARLASCYGVGSFTAAQVVADMKYVHPLLKAEDWQTWAAPGPGSRRGLNRVCLRPLDTGWKDPDWFATLQRLQKAVANLMPTLELHAQDLQNCLCEFDKYERVRLGEGRPKQLYTPYQETTK